MSDRQSQASTRLADFDNIPEKATLQPSRFKVRIPTDQIKDFKNLLKLSKIGPKTFENLQEDRKFGMTHQWLVQAKDYWEKKYDWKSTEEQINKFVQYSVAIRDDDNDPYAIHFTGLFSKSPAAIPILLLHGWPGSFLEFLKLLQNAREKYTPEDLPYHFVVPSLPGYAFSTGPPMTKEWTMEDIALMMDRLMCGLGFEEGYVAHGGDIGSMVARIMASEYPACKALHVNFNLMQQPEGVPAESITEEEMRGLARAQDFSTLGNAYAREHGQRPGTIGLVLSTNPLALLIWVAEKFLAWSDTDPSVESILESVTLYWLTSTFPRSIYPYTQMFGDSKRSGIIHPDPRYYCRKPMGYSWFPYELAPMPVSWVRTTGNLVWHKYHTEGGHFAAMEKPDLLLRDLEEFIEQLK